MTSVITEPQLLAAAAANVADINSAISAAKAAAAGPTTGLVAAAGDEVSAMTAALFGGYGQQYQAALLQAGAFHEQFVTALSAAGTAYAGAEAAAANALGTLGGDVQALLGGNAAPATATVSGALTTAAPTVPAGGTVTTLVLGASGLPIPPQAYIVGIPPLYINRFFGAGTNVGLNTPEGLYPLTGPMSLPLNTSLSQGVTILNNAINSAVASGSNTVNVFGYSQSAIISSLEMQMLNPTNTMMGSMLPTGVNLNFTLVGDPSNPNGGLFTRFPGLNLPSLGLTFGTSTPSDSFPTKIVTIEYDGFADFPQYPLNLLSDVNAFAGILYLHGNYPFLTFDQISGTPLTNTVGPTQTQYFIVPTQNLPILDPLRAIPIIGNPLADLAQPDLRVLVDLGYGSTTQGWSPDPPNVATPFGVIPPVSPITIASALATGTQQGIGAFAGDISAGIAGIPSLSNNLSLPSLPSLSNTLTGSLGTGGSSLLPALTSALSSPAGLIAALQSANTNITNAITGSTATAYATLLPTADIANALVISVPSYDVNLFLDGVEQVINGDPVGGLVYAFGAPVAADTAVGTLAAGFELRVLQLAATSIVGDASSAY